MKRWYEKVNWSAIWSLFFTTFTVSFAVLLVLRLTKEITISWWWVSSPLIAEMIVPALTIMIGMTVELFIRRK